ncbi:protein argonaute 18-like [Cryptomeria japonica]|uniref:protein argonaute 18-like n=1 Tax=Cryptomeria japonica TaxID=3369 RepID=UPI0027D9FE1D|nr:protein argonaute 18-like [Cryptomeria japonica]
MGVLYVSPPLQRASPDGVSRIQQFVSGGDITTDYKDQQPKRRGGVRQRDEEGEEVRDGGGDDGGGGGGGDRGGGWRDIGIDRERYGGWGGDGGRYRGGDRGQGGDVGRGGGLLLVVGGTGRVGAVLVVVGGIEDVRRPTQRRISDVLPPSVPQTGIERDTEREHQGWEEELAERFKRAIGGAPMRDTLRNIRYIDKEAEYYRNLYEELVPREHRAPRYAAT